MPGDKLTQRHALSPEQSQNIPRALGKLYDQMVTFFLADGGDIRTLTFRTEEAGGLPNSLVIVCEGRKSS